MTEQQDLIIFSELNKKLGLCIKDQNRVVLSQNKKCLETCGNKAGQVCETVCASLCQNILESAPVADGMKLFKSIDIDGKKLDALILNDGEKITTLLYPLDDTPEKLRKQEEYFAERGLTKSEIRIMTMVMKGMTNSAIAEELFISKSTLKTHLNNIYKKLPEAVRLARVRR